jgi:seryl-tRNA synthetase
MDDAELHEAVEKLHLELEQADDLDDESREQLQHLMSDIHTALEREAPANEEEDESLFEQLNESIQRYEASHPSITAALQHALDILSGAGI